MISVITFPSGDSISVKPFQLPGGSVINFDGQVFFRYLRKVDMAPAWISAEGEYLTDTDIEDLIPANGRALLTRF